MATKIKLNEADLKGRLSQEQFRVLREKATERPWTGKYNSLKESGSFLCGACGEELFTSDTKFESGSGWPSFWKPITTEAVEEVSDNSLLMRRTEVQCRRCGSHLGHVFPDGPEPTGLRYCINSAALEFKPAAETKKIP